jgi:TonB family protein
VNAVVCEPARAASEPAVLPIATAIAVAAHVALAAFLPAHAPSPGPTPPPLEVELAPPRHEPPPVPAPPPLIEAERTTPVVRTRGAPRPAAAGRLVAARETAAPNDAPLDFVTDPAASSYGFGVVSRGGTAGAGERAVPGVPAATPAPPVPKPVGPELVRPDDLSERPKLSVDDPCRGFYPATASVDSAEAVVRVVVDEQGGVRSVVVVSEAPGNEGFGRAASSCLRGQRFSIPRGRGGRAVATSTTIRVRFAR